MSIGRILDWQPIETLPPGRISKMFVVRAIVPPGQMSSFEYVTDPYCVWKNEDGSFGRWPHSFPPTQWLELPDQSYDRFRIQKIKD